MAQSKTKQLWDLFIEAECGSYEKLAWCDIFLAQVLVELRNGRKINEILNFGNLNGIGTLIACEILSGVHVQVVGHPGDGDELEPLQNYLINKGWLGLAVLVAMGNLSLVCSSELAHLLLFLYPLCLKNSTTVSHSKNEYLTLNAALIENLSLPKSPLKNKISSGFANISPRPELNRSVSHSTSRSRRALRAGCSSPQGETTNHSSDEPLLAGCAIQSGGGFFKLDPMDFDYFTSVVRSEDDARLDTVLYEPARRPSRASRPHPRDYVDDDTRHVMDSSVTPYEFCRLSVQLLTLLACEEHTFAVCPENSFPTCTQCIKFSIENLCNLQFASVPVNLTVSEAAELKVGWTKLLVLCLEKVMGFPDATCSVILAGILPMMLRVTEDVITKLDQEDDVDVRSRMEEVMFGLTCGILGFLHNLLFQGSDVDSLRTFLEMVNQTIDSSGGRLFDRAIYSLGRRAVHVLQLIGHLVSAIKRCRWRRNCPTSKKLRGRKLKLGDVHHHFESFGAAISNSLVPSQQSCCVSNLAMIFFRLMQSHDKVATNVLNKGLAILASCGSCCCMPIKAPIRALVNVIQHSPSKTRALAFSLYERTIYRQLGAYKSCKNTSECKFCSVEKVIDATAWKKLDIFQDTIMKFDGRRSQSTICHLIRVAPALKDPLKEIVLFRVFFPSFVQCKDGYLNEKSENQEFIILAALSIFASLLNDSSVQQFLTLKGINHTLDLICNPTFSKQCCAVLERTIVCEWKLVGESSEVTSLEMLRKVTYSTTCSFITSMGMEFGAYSAMGKKRARKTQAVDTNNTVAPLELLQTLVVFWRSFVALALHNCNLRDYFAKTSLLDECNVLLILAFEWLAKAKKYDNLALDDDNMDLYLSKLVESLLTFLLVTSTHDVGIEEKLAEMIYGSLEKCDIMLVDMKKICEVILKCSMVKPVPTVVPDAPKMPIMSIIGGVHSDDAPEITVKGESSASAEDDYVTADEGYDADVDLKKHLHFGNQTSIDSESTNNSDCENERSSPTIVYPRLCKLVVDFLIRACRDLLFTPGEDSDKRKLKCAELENSATATLTRLSALCHENTHNCLSLCRQSAVTTLLHGFSPILLDASVTYSNLRIAVLDLIMHLTKVVITPRELRTYLQLLKNDQPPVTDLLKPLVGLVNDITPRPSFNLQFPVLSPLSPESQFEKTIHRTHRTEGIISSWAHAAIVLNIPGSLNWSPWVSGCSLSIWVKINRGPRPVRKSSFTPQLPRKRSQINSARKISVMSVGRKTSRAESILSCSTAMSDFGVGGGQSSRIDDETTQLNKQAQMKNKLLMFSLGSESFSVEIWLDQLCGDMVFRATRADTTRGYEVLAEAVEDSGISNGWWHHLAVNINENVQNKKTVVEVILWLDGHREIKVQLAFGGLMLRKPRDLCLLVGHQSPHNSSSVTMSLANILLFRMPIFSREKALALAALGPNCTSLTSCRVAQPLPNFSNFIKAENLRDIDWINLLDKASCGVRDIADSLLLAYSAQEPKSLRIYQAAASGSSSIFRSNSIEVNSSQQPSVTSLPHILAPLHVKKDESLLSAVPLLGGPSIILYLFARIVELRSSGKQQASALYLLLQFVQSDVDLYTEFVSHEFHILLRKVFLSQLVKLDLHYLKAIINSCCDKCVIIESCGHLEVDMNTIAVVKNPMLLSTLLDSWLDAADSNKMLIAMFTALQALVLDLHPHHNFNVHQLNRAKIMTLLLNFCKERIMDSEKPGISEEVWRCVVELVRSMMGTPPNLSHVVGVMDALLMLHPAQNTYITNLKNCCYLHISAGQTYSNNDLFTMNDNTRDMMRQVASFSLDKWINSNPPVTDDFTSPIDVIKLSKALANLELKQSACGDDSLNPAEDSHGDNSKLVSENMNQSTPSIVRAMDGSSQNLGSFFPSIADEMTASDKGEKCVHDALQKEDGNFVISEGLLLLLRDTLVILPDNMTNPVLTHVVKMEFVLLMANNPNHLVRTAVVQLLSSYLNRAGDEIRNKFNRIRGFHHLANQIALYPASFNLAEACLNLLTPRFVALDDPAFIGQMDLTAALLARLPPLIALMPRSVHDSLLVQHIIHVLRMIFCKSTVCAKSLVDCGLVEVLVKSLLASAHLGIVSDRITSQDIVVADIQSFILLLATHFLVIPGVPNMQIVRDLRLELQYVGRVEQESCGASSRCVSVIRETQSQLHERCLDLLLEKVLSCKVDLTAGLFSFGPSSEEGRSGRSLSSSVSSHSLSNVVSTIGSKELSKGELKDRLGLFIEFSTQFLINEAALVSDNILVRQSDQNFIQHLFPLLLQLMSAIVEKKSYGRRSSANAILWSLRDTLKLEMAELLVWLLSPRHTDQMRLFAINSLLSINFSSASYKTKDVISMILQTHPQIEQKFTVFLWHLMYGGKLSGADLRTCLEVKENLQQWGVLSPHAFGNSHDVWGEECRMLLGQMDRQRGAWEKTSEAAIIRCVTKYDNLLKSAQDDAMQMTRMAMDAQNMERKGLMAEIRQKVSNDVTATALWRALVQRQTHPNAIWCDPRTLPQFWQLDPTEAPCRVRTRLRRTQLNIKSRFLKAEHQHKLGASEHPQPLWYLFARHHETCPSAVVLKRLHCNEKIRAMSPACVVTPAHEVPGEILLGESSLYFVADDAHLCSTLDVDNTCWPFEDVREVHFRRFQLQERAIELFLRTGRTYLVAFHSCEEKNNFTALSEGDLPYRKSCDSLSYYTNLWRERQITNFEYIIQLNKMAGRSFNDLMQYPVFPFILSDYTSETLDLTNPSSFRNLKKPMAVQDKQCEQHYINNYNELVNGLQQVSLNREPYHYGSHYSNAGTVLHFLVRLPPFTNMLLHYQDDNFDLPDRTFHNMATTWRLTSCDSTTDVKELIPEFFYNSEFLVNSQGFDFGVRQNGKRVDDVELPAWCNGNARRFVLIHRQALESDVVTENLGHWIDLIFGYKQTGKAAVEAINVFHPATYCGFDVASIEDPLERVAWETMVRTYGQTPRQLLRSPHPLVIHSLVPPSTPYEPVTVEVKGLKWGSYVGSRAELEPRIVWKQATLDHSVTGSLVPLSTNDVFSLPPAAVCLIRYTKEKVYNLINSTTVRAAIVTWDHPDGIIRAKIKKEQPTEPIFQVSYLDPVSTCSSAPESGQLWIGHMSGCITILKYTFRSDRPFLDFSPQPLRQQAHRSAITSIVLSMPFNIVVSSSRDGIVIIWNLNTCCFVRSLDFDEPVVLTAVSSTLGDIACISQPNNQTVLSTLHLYSINAAEIGHVNVHNCLITSVAFSSAPEGISVNVVAAGLSNGIIRLWDTWSLTHIRDIQNPAAQIPIISLTYSNDSQHLYAGCADGTVVVWEGSSMMYDRHPPKFLNLKSLL